MLTSAEYADIVNRALTHIDLPDYLPGLYDPIRYTLASGGKRIRPVLLLAAGEAFGGELSDCLWPAVGVEIFHNFTLVHDDVMDNADMRRGKPTVKAKWDVNTAILSGDAMVSMAFKAAAGCPPMFLPEVIDRFSMMTMTVYHGQQIDADFETADAVTFGQYLQMIMGKTSALIAYPCALGALIAGASPQDVEAMFNFGNNLGIAFQMQDDHLDVYGDPATFGKNIGGDILNNKKTWLRIMAHDRCPAELAKAEAIAGPAEKIAAVTAIFDSLGLRDEGERIIGRYTADAISCLDDATLTPVAKAWFIDFANTLLHREK